MTSFVLTREELGSEMRQAHTTTYFASQAPTIMGELHLTETSSRLFTLRRFIAGLSQGAVGAEIQAE